MKGLELSRAFFEQKVMPMLKSEFSEYLSQMAAGLVGHGSECFGYDDGVSADHDYGQECLIWLTDEAYEKIGFRLERAYAKMIRGSSVKKSAMGSSYRGVTTVSDFYREYTGRNGAPECWQDWLYTPLTYFAEATNGEVFFDGNGLFTSVRNQILTGMPEDVRIKRISEKAVFAAQSGQYNYERCLAHGERGAAAIALSEFVTNAAELIFLLNKRHSPYYKWMFRALGELPILSDMKEPLEFLLTESAPDKVKADIIEDIALALSREITRQGLSALDTSSLEAHAFEMAKKISDPDIRGRHIMG